MSSEVVCEEFREALAIGTMVVLAMAVAAFLSSRGKPLTMSLKSIGILGIAGIVCVVVLAYSSTFGRFTSAEITENELRLQYVGPFGGAVVLPRSGVETVLFGIPGKTNYSCYIRIQLKSGESHRSATLPKRPEVCKGLRAEMLAALTVRDAGT